jgi:hypothetical protein
MGVQVADTLLLNLKITPVDFDPAFKERPGAV